MRKFIRNKDGTITHEITFKAFPYTNDAVEKALKDILSHPSKPENKEIVDGENFTR